MRRTESQRNERTPFGIPAAPNEALVCGRIRTIEPLRDGGEVWSFQVINAASVPGALNAVVGRVGSTIQLFVHPGFKESIRPGDLVEVRISYQGDEHAAAFFLLGDGARRLGSCEPDMREPHDP